MKLSVLAAALSFVILQVYAQAVRVSIVTDAPSRFAMWMAGTLGPTWLPMHAWAFVRYIRDYLDEEREAAAVRAGIHGHTCEPAWRWRADQR